MAYIIQSQRIMRYHMSWKIATNITIKDSPIAFFLFKRIPIPNLKPPNRAIVLDKLINMCPQNIKSAPH